VTESIESWQEATLKEHAKSYTIWLILPADQAYYCRENKQGRKSHPDAWEAGPTRQARADSLALTFQRNCLGLVIRPAFGASHPFSGMCGSAPGIAANTSNILPVTGSVHDVRYAV